jgi:hypothetical protein
MAMGRKNWLNQQWNDNPGILYDHGKDTFSQPIMKSQPRESVQPWEG